METKDMIKVFNARGHYSREVGSAVPGVPDIVACVNGWFMAVETARPASRVSSLQEAHRIQILHGNGVALVGPDENELLETIKFLEDTPGARVRQAIASAPRKETVPRPLRRLCKAEYGAGLEE